MYNYSSCIYKRFKFLKYINFENPYNLKKLYDLQIECEEYEDKDGLKWGYFTLGEYFYSKTLHHFFVSVAKFLLSKKSDKLLKEKILNAIKNEEWEEFDKFEIISNKIFEKVSEFKERLYYELENAYGLPPICKQVFHKYIGLNSKPMTCKEIGKEFNVSGGRIQQIYHELFRKIRLINPETLEEYPLAMAYIYGLFKIVPNKQNKKD